MLLKFAFVKTFGSIYSDKIIFTKEPFPQLLSCLPMFCRLITSNSLSFKPLFPERRTIRLYFSNRACRPYFVPRIESIPVFISLSLSLFTTLQFCSGNNQKKRVIRKWNSKCWIRQELSPTLSWLGLLTDKPCVSSHEITCLSPDLQSYERFQLRLDSSCDEFVLALLKLLRRPYFLGYTKVCHWFTHTHTRDCTSGFCDIFWNFCKKYNQCSTIVSSF